MQSIQSADSESTTPEPLSPVQWRRQTASTFDSRYAFDDIDSLDEYTGPTLTENLGSEITKRSSSGEDKNKKRVGLLTDPDDFDWPPPVPPLPPASSTDRKHPALDRLNTTTNAHPSQSLTPSPHQPIRLSWVPPKDRDLGLSHGLLAYWEPHFTSNPTNTNDGVNGFPTRPIKQKKTGNAARWRKLDIFGAGERSSTALHNTPSFIRQLRASLDLYLVPISVCGTCRDSVGVYHVHV